LVEQTVLGLRIRQARDKIGMSQEDLASAVGKDQRAVSDYENGKRRIAATDLSTFARVLGVPVSYFYEGDIEDNPLDKVMLQEFHELPTDEARKAAIHVIRVFSDTLKSHIS
jgi:transcriptional regulator with XRE-family HTH domain